MSSGLLKFQAAERSDRSSLAIEGRLQGNIDVDVGTSGTYRPIDADIETPDKGNGSANVSVGLAGGVFEKHREDVDGKGKRHRTDSSSSSSSSSSDEDKSQDKAAKAKRKRKKKRKGILSGNFLPKFGISKKTKGKDDDTYGKGRPPSGHLEVDVPSPRELKRPTSTEVEVQVGLDAEMDLQAQGKIEGAIVDPDVEIFDGIGADHHADTDHFTKDVDTQTGSPRGNLDYEAKLGAPQSLGPLEVDVTSGPEWSPRGFTPPNVKRVTVRASSVEKHPAPALKSMDDDGTDVDLGLSAGLGDGLDDSTLENMDTSDLLSQIENTIQSIEAAHNQHSNADVSDISMNVDHPVRPQGDTRLQSADTRAFDVDSDATLRVHLAKPKDGPILELPEDNQANTKVNAIDVSVEHLSPSMSLETDFGNGRTSSASSSRSSQSEQKDKSKGVFPSMKFHMPKFGGKKAVKKGAATGNVDGNTGVDLDVSAQPDLATSAHDIDNSYEAPHGNLDLDLPDLDKSASGDVSFNSSLNVTDGSTVDINGDDMQDSRQVAIGFGIDHLSPPGDEDSDDDSDIDAYLGAAAIDVGLPVPADIDFDGEVDTPGRGNVEVPVKPMSKKGKRKLPKFKFGKKKAGKGDLPSGTLSLDTKLPELEGEAGVDADIDVKDNQRDTTFEVIGKRASLKRSIDIPDVETPVTPQLEVDVESSPTHMQDSRQVAIGFGVDHLSPPGDEDSDDDSDIDAYLGAVDIEVGLPVPADIDFDGEVDTPGRGNVEVPVKPMSKKGKRKLPKFKFGKKKAGKGDLPSGTLSLDTKLPELEGEAGVDADIDVKDNQRDTTFEVIGKRASLKRSIDIPDVETPVTPQLEVDVESSPKDFEVAVQSTPKINMPYPTVDIDMKDGDIDEDVRFALKGGDATNLTLGSDGRYDRPDLKLDGEGFPLDGNLNVEGDLSVDESSDIEAYIGISSPDDSFVPGITAVGPTIQGPDSSGKGSFQYNKGKMSQKGKRNLPKAKSKGSRNAFGKKAKSPESRLDVDVDKNGSGSGDLHMTIDSPDFDVGDSAGAMSRHKAEVKASSSEPNLTFSGDAKGNRKGFTLPRLKMPKFKRGARKSSKDKRASDSFDFDVGGTSSPSAKRSSSLPDISYGNDGERVGDSNSYVGAEHKKKKRWSTGFKLPNFGLPKFGGKQRPKSETDKHVFDSTPEADVSVTRPVVSGNFAMDVDTPEDDVFCDVVAEVKTPKSDFNYGSGVPDFEKNANASFKFPEGEVEVDQRGDAKGPGWSQPERGDIELKDSKFDFPEGDLDVKLVEEVDSPHITFGKPEVDVKTDIPKGMQFQFETTRGDGDVDNVELDKEARGNISLPGVGLTGKRDGDSESVTSSSSSSSSEPKTTKMKKKKGLFGGIHLPKFKGKGSSKKHIGTGVSFDDEEMDIDLDIPTGSVDMDRDGVNVDVVTPDFIVDQKKLKPGMDVDVDIKMGGSGNHPHGEGAIGDNDGTAKVALTGHNLDLPEVSVNDRGNDVTFPSATVEVDSNGKPSAGLSTGLTANADIPAKGLNLAADVDIDHDFSLSGGDAKIRADGDDHSVSSSSSSSSVDEKTKKRRGLFGGLHFPKFKGKGANRKSGSKDINFHNDQTVGVDIDQTKGDLNIHDVGVDANVVIPDVSVNVQKLKPEPDANISTPDVNLPSVSAGADQPMGEADVNVGIDVGADIQKRAFDLPDPHPDVDVPSHDVEINVGYKPTISAEVDINQPDKKFNLDGDVERPSGDADVDVGGSVGITLPAAGFKMKRDDDTKSVSSTSSSSSSSSSKSEKAKKKKKGLFGGFHLPKFKGKGSPKRSMESGVTLDVGDDVCGMDANLQVDADIGADVVIADVSADQRKLKPDLDVDISVPDVNLPVVSGKISPSLDDSEIDGNIRDINIDADLNVQKGDLPSPDYANGVGDLNVLSGGLDVDVNVKADADISDKFDASIDVPDEEVDVGAKGELNLPKFGANVKGYGDNESVTSSSSSSSSESEKTAKKKKGFFAGIHLPKFKGKGPTTKAIGTGVSFDDADDDIGVGINLPRGSLELGYEGDVAVPDVNVDQRAPKLDVSTDAALDVNIPDISGPADLPQGNVELDFPDDEGAIDVSVPGIREPDVDLHLKTRSDNPNTKIISGDVDLPQGETNIEVPEFAGTLKAGDNISVTSSSSSSSEEEKAKKKRSLFGGFSMPKFKGKGSGKKSGIKADASFDNGEHGIGVGSDDVLPGTDVTQKEFKADMDINVTTPDIDLPDVSGDIDIPVKSADVDFPADRNADTDITISSPDVSFPQVAVNTNSDADLPSANVTADPSVNDREGNVDLSLPDVEVDFDASGGIDIPTFGIKGSGDRDSITSKSSSSSSESEKTSKKKKGLFGGFHMPKFKGKGSKKKGGRDFDGDIPGATLDLGGGDFSVGADVVTPSATFNQKESKPDIDVDFKIPDTDLLDVSADVDIPTAAVKVDVPGGRADMEISNPDTDLPELEEKVDVDFSAPKLMADVSVGDRDPDMDLKGEIKLPQFDGDFDAGGGIRIPTEGPEKPTVGLDTSDLDLDTNVELSSDADVNVSIPKPSLQSPDVPNSIDFAVGPGEVNVDMEQPDASGGLGVNIHVPKLDISRGTDEDGSNDEVETIGFKVTKPTLDLKGESNVDFNTPDVDTEVNLDPTLNIPGDAEVAVRLPTGDLSADGDFTTPRVDVKVEKKEVKNVRFPVGLISKDDDSSSTTSSSSSSCDDDKKKKKGFFASLHFPKFKGKGAKKKADVQISGKADVSTDVDIDLDVDGDLNLKGQFVAPEVEIPEGHGDLAPEVDVTVKVGKPDEVSIDEPSFKVNADANPDKFGINLRGPELKGSFDLPPVEVDSDLKIDQRAPDVNVTIGGVRDQITVDGEGSLDIPDHVDVDADLHGPEVNVDPSVDLPDAKFGLSVDTGKVDTDIPGMNDVHADLPQVNTEVKERGGLKVDVDPSLPRGAVVLPEFQTGLKKDDASSSSSDDEEDVKEPEEGKKKKKGFLPSFHFPKMKLKRPKSPDKKKGLSAASVEVELKLDVDVPDKDVEGAVTTGPDLWDSPPDNDQHTLDVSLPEGDVSLQVEEPDVALSAAKPDRPEINLAFLGGAKGAAVNFDADVNVGADDDIDIDRNKISIDTSTPDASGDKEDEITFEKFGKLLAEAEQFDQIDSSEESEGDLGEQDPNFDGEVKLQANIPAAAAKTDRKLDLDFDWAQLGLNVSDDDDDEIDPSTDLNAKISLTKSSSKSSLSSSSSSVEENKETKKTKGFLPSLKFPKFTGGKGQEKHQGPKVNAEGDVVGEMPLGMEGKLSPSIKVDVEASPPNGSSPKGGKSPKGRLGLFKKGRGKVDSPQFTQQDVSLQTDRVVPGVSASVESTPPRPGSGLHPPSTLSPPGTLDLSGAVATHSMPTTPLPTSPSTPQTDFSVVVAIDFGTTFSGYAYSFTKDPDAVHVMRKCEGGDPGVINMKTLTTLLLTPEGEFHSFGFTARDFYHDMKFTEAQKWLYFDKYKLALQDDKNLNIDTEIEASNGTKVKALTVFQLTFRFLKDRFLEELADLSMDDGAIDEGDIRWVLTVPAIWRQPAKQFMRQAAYKAGIASPSRPSQLMIALEPEAASIFIGKLSMKQLMPERMALRRERWLRGSMGKGHDPDMKVIEDVKQGSRYVVVDCGGGTVDITVHEVEEESGTLKELHKASGGMFGSGNVDEAFISLMVDIFGEDFIQEFKLMRPAGWVDLLIAFEARKRNANPWKANYLNVSLPFSFIDYYKKFTNGNLTVEQTLLEYNSEDVKWSGQAPGMLRFSPKGMLKLFSPTTDQLLEKVDQVLAKPELKGISHLFLAGGFAESPLLQNKIRDKYKDFLKVVIPQEVGLATMKGAVMFGQNPWAVSARRTRLMYGVGALNKFNSKIHPEEKKIVKDGVEWCRDVFDVFVMADQSISAGEKVTRSYAPASAEQEAIKINIYCSENENARFITDDQVRQCGTLTIDLRSQSKPATRRRELQLSMHFGDTEMRVDALDVTTGKKVEARVDFLNN